MKNKLRERERERERERSSIFMWENYAKNEKRKCQIYSKMLRIRRVKINEDKKVEKKWY